MLKVLLCVCLCLAVVLAQEEEPPKEPELELYARNRREATMNEMVDSMSSAAKAASDTGIQVARQFGQAFAGAADKMASSAGGFGQNTRRRRDMPQGHPHPPPPPQGGNMPQPQGQ